jgi:hypothetical protein
MKLKKKAPSLAILLTLLLLLAACGDATNTPALTTSPAALGRPTLAAGVTPGANGGFTGQAPISGTIESFDSTSNLLSVKAADGTSQKFSTTSSMVSKQEKLSSDDFGKQLSGKLVLVQGQLNSNGSYDASSITLVDMSNFGGGQPGAGGPPGGGQPPAGMGGGPGGADLGTIILNGTLTGTTLTGTGFTGETVTAKISSSTALTLQAAANTADLKAGLKVTINAMPAQGTTPAQAINIVLI